MLRESGYPVAIVSMPATITSTITALRNTVAGSLRVDHEPMRFPRHPAATHAGSIGHSTAWGTSLRDHSMPSDVMLVTTKYPARSTMKTSGGICARVSKSTGGGPLRDVVMPR